MTETLIDTSADQLARKGWVQFPHDAEIAAWAKAALPVARSCMADPQHRAEWLRSGGTWFVGPSVLPNDGQGAVRGQGVPPLSGAAIRAVGDWLGFSGFDWDRGQVSACFPGYPRQDADESDAAFRFRRDRDAAHLDGLMLIDGRRRLCEYHGFILGLPLTDHAPEAAPFTIWEGSHEVIRRAFQARLADIPPERWGEEDVTEIYTKARREVFETCPRVLVHARPGEAYLVHRLAIHGVAPWPEDAASQEQGAPDSARIIAYFRPDPFPGASPEWWLSHP